MKRVTLLSAGWEGAAYERSTDEGNIEGDVFLAGKALNPGQFRKGSYAREDSIGGYFAVRSAIDGLEGKTDVVQGHLVLVVVLMTSQD